MSSMLSRLSKQLVEFRTVDLGFQIRIFVKKEVFKEAEPTTEMAMGQNLRYLHEHPLLAFNFFHLSKG